MCGSVALRLAKLSCRRIQIDAYLLGLDILFSPSRNLLQQIEHQLKIYISHLFPDQDASSDVNGLQL